MGSSSTGTGSGSDMSSGGSSIVAGTENSRSGLGVNWSTN
jgi:hypothetical protein